MQQCPGAPHQYTIADPAFDSAHGELFCKWLRRDPRVTHASHASDDYSGLRLKLELAPSTKESPQDLFREAATYLANRVRSIREDLERSI